VDQLDGFTRRKVVRGRFSSSKAAAYECVERQRAPLARAAERLRAVQQPAGKDVEVPDLGLEADDRARKLLAATVDEVDLSGLAAGLGVEWYWLTIQNA
jgi:hypothetical protein